MCWTTVQLGFQLPIRFGLEYQVGVSRGRRRGWKAGAQGMFFFAEGLRTGYYEWVQSAKQSLTRVCAPATTVDRPTLWFL